MKVLVIGERGQLARSLCEMSASFDVSLVTLGRPELDLLQPPSITRALNRLEPDLVVNTAAYTAVDKAEKEPELTFAVNAEGARVVAEACARRGLPLVHISTDYVFDGRSTGPLDEDCATAPVSTYGRSKLEGERLVAAACPEHLIVRTAWLYSPFGQNFVKTILRLAQCQNEVRVVDDQIGTPTYALHLAAAILKIIYEIKTRSVAWGIYHLAGSGEASWYQLAREVLSDAGDLGGPLAQLLPIKTADYRAPARRPHDSRLDCAKCLRVFGVSLPHWRYGVADCVSRFLSQ